MSYKFQKGDGALSGSVDIAGRLSVVKGDTTEGGPIVNTFGVDKQGNVNIPQHDPDNSTGFKLAGTLITSTAAELNLVDGSSAGSAVASKAVIYDAQKGITAISLTGSHLSASNGITGSSLRMGAYGLTNDGGLAIAKMNTNWTNAGRTVADLGTVTTIDLNGGAIDGTIIGANSAVAGNFTTLTATTLVGGSPLTISASSITVTGSLILSGGTATTTTLTGSGGYTSTSTTGSMTSGSDGSTETGPGYTTLSGSSYHTLSASGSFSSGSDGSISSSHAATTWSGSSYYTLSASGSMTSGSCGSIYGSHCVTTWKGQGHGTTGVKSIIELSGGYVSASKGITAHSITGSYLTVSGSLTATCDDIIFQSTHTTDPTVVIKNTTNDATGARLRFVKDKGAAGAANDVAGVIEFYADDANQDQVLFVQIEGAVETATNGQEGGRLVLGVASHDGEMNVGLLLVDGDAEDEIDVTIGNTTTSVVTIAGDLKVTTDIILDDGGSLKEAGGTAAFTYDGSGDVTKIGQDSPSSGEFLKWDGSKAVWDSAAAKNVETYGAAPLGTSISASCDFALIKSGAVRPGPGGAVYTLPTPSAGKYLDVKLSGSQANVTLKALVGDAIEDGGSQSTILLEATGSAVTLVAYDATHWFVI